MRTIVVGAGLSGLVAARELFTAGHQVTVFDKGRSVGGRLATRRMSGARLDHGAQFFTVRSEQFASVVRGWSEAGVVREWCRGFESADGHPRYVGDEGMTSIAKHLADGIDVRCGVLVFSVSRSTHGWTVVLDDGSEHTCDSLIMTAPIPQAMSMLVTAGVELPQRLREIDYDRTIALLAVVAGGRHNVGAPGGRQHPDDVFSFVADNRAKGISHTDALTFHANADWSRNNWDTETAVLHDLLLSLASPYFGDAHVVESQVKKWRFAIPQTLWDEPCWVEDTGTLVLAGDAFAGPRVEGATLSGLAAARELLSGPVS